ncbi:MAG: MFS transporter [Actinobacteria bacterium]|nr:MFS transporter [Actinomycetota bacterium]
MRSRLPPALRERDFALLWVASGTTGLASQMILVAVGWQVYEIHRNPFDLGLIGLAEFVPLLLLALPAGQLADRVSRRAIIAVALVVDTAVAALLLVVTVADARTLWPYLALAALTGAAASVSAPALRALLPELVAPELMASAMALRAVSWQSAVVAGPVVGGVLFSALPELPYAVAVGLFLVAVGCVLAVRRRPAAVLRGDETFGWASLVGGVRFLLRTRMVLGAILLDLFAVLFGGAISLAPVFASSILHVGPVGLGALRSAPAVGAVVAGVLLARRPLRRPAGPTLLIVVALFGVSMIAFGLSRWLPLSLAALAVAGFVDMISMNIRATTVALVTPNELRGRVMAVEMVFIGASNELGAFESGVVASLVGTVASVVAGGVATIAIALAWTRLFPSLAHLRRLEDLQPEPVRVA